MRSDGPGQANGPTWSFSANGHAFFNADVAQRRPEFVATELNFAGVSRFRFAFTRRGPAARGRAREKAGEFGPRSGVGARGSSNCSAALPGPLRKRLRAGQELPRLAGWIRPRRAVVFRRLVRGSAPAGETPRSSTAERRFRARRPTNASFWRPASGKTCSRCCIFTGSARTSRTPMRLPNAPAVAGVLETAFLAAAHPKARAPGEGQESFGCGFLKSGSSCRARARGQAAAATPAAAERRMIECDSRGQNYLSPQRGLGRGRGSAFGKGARRRAINGERGWFFS